MPYQPDPNHLTKDSFDKSYDGVPPWEIGKPQPEMMAQLDAGHVTGAVIDIGCGTGELTLEMARRGWKVAGVDSSPKAIERARHKALQRKLDVPFYVFDALKLNELPQTFDTAIDCGLFHVFTDAERAEYVRALHGVLNPGGRLILMCFSPLETREGGPRRVTETELRSAFAAGWTIEELRATVFEALTFAGGAAAWLVRLRRVP